MYQQRSSGEQAFGRDIAELRKTINNTVRQYWLTETSVALTTVQILSWHKSQLGD
jgi:hypothetical protein